MTIRRCRERASTMVWLYERCFELRVLLQRGFPFAAYT